MPDLTEDRLRIDASPTKEFFIHMLTRDVPLSRAIIDLVDNSVDGAQRLRKEGRYDGLWIRIEVNADSFAVSDNCGGIPIDIAKNYAFRFGRPKDAADSPGSVGVFGVGMKRTFFKLGRCFSVESRCRTEGFVMNVDVDQWILGDEDAPDDWHFQFDSANKDLAEVSNEETGTTIRVTNLYPTVTANFALETFQTQLWRELSAAHAVSVDKGLAITLNLLPLDHLPQSLFVSDAIKPAYVEKEYPRMQIDGCEGEPVRVKLYAGVAKREYQEGGWYIFCNGRLVLKADQTYLTVWGETHGLRRYHGELAFFRGYAFFDSRHSTLLPWTTTKTGVDTDAPIYKVVQREMIEMTKPVISFLNELAKQTSADNQGEWSDKSLANAITTASAMRTDNISSHTQFQAPQPIVRPPGPRMQRIQYSKTADEVEKAKSLLGVTSYKDVGERTFEYYLQYEGGE